jgi:hypothetical protein
VWLVTAMLGLTIVAAGIAGTFPSTVVRPVQSARNFFGEAQTMVSTHKQAAVMAASRTALRYPSPLPPAMVKLMQGNTVAVSPWQVGEIWARPAIRFDPLPVLQDYSAFTSSLDQLDTTFLASSGAPRYILRQPLAVIDGRNPTFEPPGAQLAMECRYREVSADAVWQLLERQPDRCGRPRLISSITTGVGHVVTVPAAPAGDDVVATFHLSTGVVMSVESLLFKPPNVFLVANNGQETWRFITATGPEFHVLEASSNLGFSSAFVPVSAHNLRFLVKGKTPSSTGIGISFYEVPMATAQGSPGAPQ